MLRVDHWRPIYNEQRPHDALALDTPIERYRPSPRAFPEQLPAIEYGPHDVVAVAGWNGRVRFKGRTIKVSNLHKLPIAFRPDQTAPTTFTLATRTSCA